MDRAMEVAKKCKVASGFGLYAIRVGLKGKIGRAYLDGSVNVRSSVKISGAAT